MAAVRSQFVRRCGHPFGTESLLECGDYFRPLSVDKDGTVWVGIGGGGRELGREVPRQISLSSPTSVVVGIVREGDRVVEYVL